MPRLRRNGAKPARAGCQPGANRKVTPTVSKAATTWVRGACSLKPRPSNTSAEPTRPLALRLPCFATTAPQAAAVKATAVEMLKLLAPSPPVPQLSTIDSPGRGQGKGAAWRKTWAMAASSWGLGSRLRRAAKKAPVCTADSCSLNQASIRALASDSASRPPSRMRSNSSGQGLGGAELMGMGLGTELKLGF